MFTEIICLQIIGNVLQLSMSKMEYTMKAYGHSRRDKLECKYGCCTLKSGAKKSCRKVVDRTKRKAARRIARREEEVEVE